MSNPYKAPDSFLNICRASVEHGQPPAAIPRSIDPKITRQIVSRGSNKDQVTCSQKAQSRKRKRHERQVESNGKGAAPFTKQPQRSKEVKVVSLLSDDEDKGNKKSQQVPPRESAAVQYGDSQRYMQQVPGLASDQAARPTSSLPTPPPSSKYGFPALSLPETQHYLPSEIARSTNQLPYYQATDHLQPQYYYYPHNQDVYPSPLPYGDPNEGTPYDLWNGQSWSDGAFLPPADVSQLYSSTPITNSTSALPAGATSQAQHDWNSGFQARVQDFMMQPQLESHSQTSRGEKGTNSAQPPFPQAQQQIKNPNPQNTGESATPPSALVEPALSDEQRVLVDKIISGRNVFYTGSAGTGKSTVLKAFVARLRSKSKTVNIIAPTGRAALDINGVTFWTYAGWTPDSMKRPLKELLDTAHRKTVWKRLTSTDVLVIDEVSMMENWHFERLNKLLKEARGSGGQPSHKAFGGVQLVVTGDFCQLPPVKPFGHCLYCGKETVMLRGGTVYRCPKHGEVQDTEKWAFCSKAWEECQFEHINFKKIHRQSDEVFIKVLQKCRLGIPLVEEDKSLLLNHECKTNNAVKLFSTREEVKRVNDAEFTRLKSSKHTYKSLDFFQWNKEHVNLKSKSQRSPLGGSLTALYDHRYEASVDLKQGMLVVLLANIDIANGLVNGSQGVIVGFRDHQDSDIPEQKKGSVEGMPDYSSYKERSIKEFIQQSPKMKWPNVRFNNGFTRTIVADCPVNELGDHAPWSLISRTQVPLTAAWAVSIHKSQGMTLDRVMVDLSRSFEEGQMYVALSRARTLEGLKVEGLGSFRNGGNEEVKRFLADKFGNKM